MVDWVLLELRSQNDSTLIVDRKAVWLDKEGNLRDVNGGYPQLSLNGFFGPVYVVVSHRNHIDIMSAGTVGRKGRIYHRYMTDLNSIRNNQGLPTPPAFEIIPGTALMISGDISGNGVINSADIQGCMQNYFVPGYLIQDPSLSGIINAVDIQLQIIHYFHQSHVVPSN